MGDFVPWYGAEARILLAQASLGLADVLRARTLLAEASRFARRCQDVLIFRQWFDAAWALEPPSIRAGGTASLGLSGKPGLTVTEMVPAFGAGVIRALYILGEDPVMTEPDVSGKETAFPGVSFQEEDRRDYPLGRHPSRGLHARP